MLNKIKGCRGQLIFVSFVVFIAFAIIIVPSSQMQDRSMMKKDMTQMSADEMLNGWSGIAREAAMKTMEKYGQPNESTPSMLIWHNNGPWKRTIIYREEVQHNFPMPHKDVLEQFINFNVPTDKFSALAEYDGSVIAERTKGEISARCDKEAMNFLALNLASDIVTNKRSVKEARDQFAKTAMAFMKGDMMPYTQGLQFQVPTGDVTNPDQPSKMMDKNPKMDNNRKNKN